MSIYIHNSLTRKKEEFLPLNPPVVNMYTCGVTVYDDCHIGHARSLYIFDVMRRYLKYKNYDVKFVRNITDIDDKIINKAKELGISAKEVSEKYIDSYYKDLVALGIEKADFEPKATDNIEEMKKYIQGLIDKGFAYATNTGVYFSVRKFKDYGKLSGQTIDQMLTGVRKEPDETKNDPLDFALWKLSKPGEPSWPSPWGEGRPGWHIECSVMSQKFLKADTLDIHAGGRDLIFPHHENEISQGEALTGKQFAKYWIHHGLLTINSQKMSKSLGNFVTIRDALKKYPADVLKLFYLASHYASPVDFTERKIEEAKKRLEKISIFFKKINNLELSIKSRASVGIYDQIQKIKDEFIVEMDNDFNTPRALVYIFALVAIANKKLAEAEINFAIAAKIYIQEMLGVLGLDLKEVVVDLAISDDEVDRILQERESARKAKNYALSDKIRKELELKGVIIEDAKDGKTTWRRKL
jgi:cysteinyl-tRNA synthetase